MVWRRYKQQKSRGQQGFGYVSVDKDLGVKSVRTTTEKGIREHLEKEDAPIILFHHRYPTSTPNVVESAHPILVKNDLLEYNYLVLHNGVIRNSLSLRAKHLALGFQYNTDLEITETIEWKTPKGQIYREEEEPRTIFNDSETLAIETALAIEGKKPTIDTLGSVACLVLQINKSTGKAVSFYYFRNEGNPLLVTSKAEGFVLASELGGDNVASDYLRKMDLLSGNVEVTAIRSPKLSELVPTTYHTSKGWSQSTDPLLDVPHRIVGFHSADKRDLLTTVEEDLRNSKGGIDDDSLLWEEQANLINSDLSDLEMEAGTLEDIIAEGATDLEKARTKAIESDNWSEFESLWISLQEARKRQKEVEEEIQHRTLTAF